MRKRYFLKLVRKHLNGRASVEEEQLLLSYYSLFEFEPDVIALLNDEEKEKIKVQMNTAIWQRISMQEESDKKIRRLKIVYIKVAAAVLIGAFITAVFFLPRLKTAQLIVTQQYNQKNQNRLIHLPDGSTVVIMKDSKITYSPEYDKLDRREVYLEGQAYFDVKHNISRPFIVHTGSLQTIVLGTAFNIRALKGDNKIIVTVTRGKVSVGNQYKVFGTVTPDQQIIFNKDMAKVVIKKVDANTYLFWKKEDLLFDDVTMKEAAMLLEERFKVNIAFADPKLMLNRFTTTFQHDESLEHELDIICEFNNTTYTYDRDHGKVVISNKTN